MKIARIEAYKVDLPYSGGLYLLSGGREYRSFDASIVRILCDDGTEGWGESTPFGSTYVASHALGTRGYRGDRAGAAGPGPPAGRPPQRPDGCHARRP